MQQLTIRFEGMEWPLETFLDSHGFTRFDYSRSPDELPALATADVWANAVLADGTMVEARARDLPWHELIAFRPRDGEALACDWCGNWEAASSLVVIADGTSICDNCHDNADYDE
ncbi:hypothetical protein [Novosphingobium sp.]|uniref:hypothetical protein n=1 Tax=Novosphingobium sp. TaxID=1874826 RepID=UPI0038B74167